MIDDSDTSSLTAVLRRSVAWLIDNGHLHDKLSRDEKIEVVRANIPSKSITRRMIECAVDAEIK